MEFTRRKILRVKQDVYFSEPQRLSVVLARLLKDHITDVGGGVQGVRAYPQSFDLAKSPKIRGNLGKLV